MSRSILGHISRRGVHAVLGVFLVGILLFVALTRTQVGRDRVARELERLFEAQTGARLSIDQLTGNLSQDLFAAGVEARTPSGALIFHIDSVVVRPRWSALLRKEFSIHEISLFKPTVDLSLLRDSLGSAVVVPEADSLRESAEATAPNAWDGGWRFKNASLRIQDGYITNAPGLNVEENSTIEALVLHSLLSADEEGSQLDILDLQARIPSSDLDIRSASAQLVVDARLWSLNQMHIQTSRSNWHLRGSLAAPSEETAWYERSFQLEIEPSDVNFDEVRSLVPSLPLHDSGRFSAYLSGPISELTVPWIRLEHGRSSLALEGTALGYPGTMDLEVSVSDVRLFPEDIRKLLPERRVVRNVQAIISDLQVYANGTVTPIRNPDGSMTSMILDTRSTFDLSSNAGLISGTLSLKGSPGDTLRHEVSVRLEEVDAYPWTQKARWHTSANGYLSASGALWNSNQFETAINARLSPVSMDRRRADSLHADLIVQPDLVSGNLTLFSGSGFLDNRFSLQREEDGTPLLTNRSEAAELDIGPLLGSANVSSRINAVVQGSSHLRWDRGFRANIEALVDTSALMLEGVSTDVPPHSVTMVVSPPSPGRPVLDLASNIGDLRIESPVAVPTLVSLSRVWLTAFKAAWDEERRKQLRETSGDALDPEVTLDALLAADAARARFPTGIPSAQAQIQARLYSGTMLSSLLPRLPDMEGAADLFLDLDWTADSLHAAVSGASEAFRYGGAMLRTSSLKGYASTVRGQSVLSTLASELSLTADTVSMGGASLAGNLLSLSAAQGSGRISASSGGTQRLDSLHLQAEWQRLEDRNQLRWSDLEIDTGDGSWLLEKPATIGLYGDALTLDDLRIYYLRDGEQTGQSVSAAGIFSGSAADSLQVGFEDLELLPLSNFLEWRRSLGGLVNANLILAGGYEQPRISGALSVDTLSLDYHILGNARLQSSYVASRPDLAVDLQLDPISPDPRAVLFGTASPASVRQNQLSVGGTLRLPGSRTDRDGSLDLEAVVDQADVFWLTYLFPEVVGSVGGYLSGEGRITGSFAYPVFDARLGIVDGRFTVPYTKMAYGASGSLRLDREAIHFEPLRLTDGTGGYLDVDGRLLFNEYTSFTFDMQGALDEFQIMNVAESDELPFYGFLWASGDVALTGPLFNSRLVSTNGRTTSGSKLFSPIVEDTRDTDQAFVVFEETPGVIPDFRQLESRSSILQKRPTSERQFLDGLNLDLNIDAPAGSIVHLVIDPLLGDVINAVSTGTIQLVLENDEFQVFGRLDVTSGDYQFTAGELFIKTFLINPGGFIEWSGDPINAALSIPASYRTRASRAGLPGAEGERPGVIPLIVDLEIGGTVESPDVELTLSIDRSNQNVIGEYQALEALLNQPDRATEYATSVLILNSFQLTTESITTDSGGQLAFNSVSQLVTAQLNRFLESALPNVDVSLGLQGESAQDLDVTYGVALRLLNERLIIRGEGVYQGARSTESVRTSDGLQGEFVVEIRIGPHVSAEIFFRRESDILESTQLTNTAGVGLSYQTEFESWRSIFCQKQP